MSNFSYVIKFRLSEKHTKFEKIILMVLTNQLIYLVNVKTIRKIFSNYVCFSKSPNFTSLVNIILKLQSSTFNRNSRIGCSNPYFWDCTALLIEFLFSLIYDAYSEFGNLWNHMMNIRVEGSVLKAFHGKVRKHQLCIGACLTEVSYCKLPWWGRSHRG